MPGSGSLGGSPSSGLSSGTVAASSTVVFLAGVGTSVRIDWFSLYNSGSTIETVTMKVNRGSARVAAVAVLDPGERAEIVHDGGTLPLASGESVELASTNAGVVNYDIGGGVA